MPGGETPLIRAVQIHNADIVRALLDAGPIPTRPISAAANRHATMPVRTRATRQSPS
jgi:hypothetical protein